MGKSFPICVIEFEPMAMAFADYRSLLIDLVCDGAGRQFAVVGPQTHSTPFFRRFFLLLHHINDRIGRIGVYLCGCG